MTAWRKLLPIFLFALVAGAALGCGGGDSPPTQVVSVKTSPVANPSPTPTAVVELVDREVNSFTVHLSLNGSSQSGTATFTRVNDYARVELRLRPGVPDQAVTIRRGACPDSEGFVRSMDHAIGGILRQELRNTPFDELLEGDLTLVVTVPSGDFNDIAACADLPRVN